MTHRLVFTLLVILIMETAIDANAQYPSTRELGEQIERLLPEDQRPAFREQNLKLLEKEKYRLTTNGSRQYCAVDHGGAPASRRPYRWCRYDDMASCLDATHGRSNYSCEQNRVYEADERKP